MVAFGTLGLDAGVNVINKPVAVEANGDDRGMAVLAGFALDTLNTLSTLLALRTLGSVLTVLAILAVLAVGDSEGRGGIITISDRVSVD